MDKKVEDFLDGSETPEEEDVAKTIKVSGDDRGMEMKNEYSIAELMKIVGAVDNEKDALKIVERAPLPQRPKGPVTEMTGKTIARSTKKE